MPQVQPETTELKAQYASQLAADLERNAKEQERINAEVAALQEQLHALQRDQALLVSMQQALGGESPAAAPEAAAADAVPVPTPRKASAAPRTRPRKKATAQSKKTAAKTPVAGKAPTAKTAPTLGELIREHLSRQTEPRSAAEVTAALAQAHPERNPKDKVVRVTLEGLVAKGHVQRTKQGKSVFYSPADTAADSAPDASTEPADAPAADTSA
ncbi:BlaI/MecI/CopY family transcriptional regulator [Streptomyces xiangluensis]|uniref:BlaI/MecI/CopY family transcriptional regulator n=1 Tax=Streptomyces xiangluensis TaxID=2665720 RepID=A0ABV8YZN8_9ACTN